MRENKNNVYSDLSNKAQEVAPKIEALLKGLSIDETIKLLYRVKASVSQKTIVELSAV